MGQTDGPLHSRVRSDSDGTAAHEKVSECLVFPWIIIWQLGRQAMAKLGCARTRDGVVTMPKVTLERGYERMRILQSEYFLSP